MKTEKKLLVDLEKTFNFNRGKIPLLEDFKKKSEYLAAKYQFKHFGSPLAQNASDAEIQKIWNVFNNYTMELQNSLTFLYKWANGSDEDVLRKGLEFLKIKDALDLTKSYKLLDNDEPLIMCKNLASFYPVFSLHSDDIIGDIGVFIDGDTSVYLLDMDEACVYKLFDSIYVLLQFLVASMDLKKHKRGYGVAYSKEELLILESLNKSEVYPIVKERGITIFS